MAHALAAVALAVLGLPVLWASPASALSLAPDRTCTWTAASGTDTNWSNPANWSCDDTNPGPPDANDVALFPGTVPGSGTVTYDSGVTTVVLNKIEFDNTYTVDTTGNATPAPLGLNPGTDVPGFVVTGGSPTYNAPLELAAGGSQIFDVAAGSTATINGLVSGTTAIDALQVNDGANSGTLVLGGGNTYEGGTTVVAGIVKLTNGAGFGTGPVVAYNSTIQLAAVTPTNDLTLGADGLGDGALQAVVAPSGWSTGVITLAANTVDRMSSTSGTLAIASQITGAGALLNTGFGQTLLTAANDYSGGTEVAGYLLIENSQALGTGAAKVDGGGWLYLQNTGSPLDVGNDLTFGSGSGTAYVIDNTSDTWSGTITLVPGGVNYLGVSSGRTLTVDGVIQGVGHITFNGFTFTGNVDLWGDNTYTGGTTIENGTVFAENAHVFGTGSVTTTVGTPGIELRNDATVANPLTAAVASRVTAADGTNDTWAGNISLTGGSSATLTLVGQGSGSLVVSESITGNLPQPAIGILGTVTLAGPANTYTGRTVVNTSSTLLLDSTITSAVNPLSGTLTGTGSTTGITTDSSNGGTVLPGNGGGVLTSTGSVTFASTSSTNDDHFGVVIEGVDPVSPQGYSQLHVTSGTVDLGQGPVLDVSILFYTPAHGQQFDIIKNDGASAVTGTFAGLPEGSSFTADGQTFTITYAGGASGQDVVLTDTTPVPPSPPSPPTPGPAQQGYWLVAADGGVFSFGSAPFEGSTGGSFLTAPVVGMAATPDHAGYWLAAADGGVFAYGDARFQGSTGGATLNAPVVGIAAAPDGRGYWLVASDGGVFAYGTARFHGSTGGAALNAPIVGIAAAPDGGGYWLVASDGGVFAYGTARFEGSTGGTHLNAPIVGMAATSDGTGYWLVASDGGVFAYGNARFKGSTGGTHLNAPIVGMSAPDTGGYWLMAADGGVFAYGDADFEGSMGGTRLVAPVVGGAGAV